jgi:hypothetical protein
MGRPSTYSPEVVEAICERLALGESLRSICADDAMPAMSSVFKWLTEHPEFSAQYAHAREEQAEALADEIVAIADEECTMVRAEKHGAKADDDDGNVEVVFDATAVARNRLRIDARKWVASKLKPKKYGDKIQQEVTGKDGGPIETKGEVLVRPPITRQEWMEAHGLDTPAGTPASGA